jgi:hypothetical protein
VEFYGGAVADGLNPGYQESGVSGGGIPGDAGRVFRSDAERDAYFDAVAAARRAALRDAELSRQQDRSLRAGLDQGEAARDLDWAERERRNAERLDLRPVGAGPFDRADIERREALFDETRALNDYERAARLTSSERARLDRLSRADRIQDRIDRLDRMQRRHEARVSPVVTP